MLSTDWAAGGKQKGTDGYFVEPTVFSDVQDHFKIAKEVNILCLATSSLM